MRISDWSSDVCSSDLTNLLGPNDGPEAGDAAGSTCGVAPTMRVLHLSTFDIRGGAASGTYWLHQALARRDGDSSMQVGRKYSGDPTVTEQHGRETGRERGGRYVGNWGGGESTEKKK